MIRFTRDSGDYKMGMERDLGAAEAAFLAAGDAIRVTTRNPAGNDRAVRVDPDSGLLVDASGRAASLASIKTPNGRLRPTLIAVGNSIAGQSVRNGSVFTSSIVAAEVRAGANQITLVAGGVAALGLAQNDYITVSLCSQAPWPVQVTAIAGEVLTLAKRLPRMLRASAGVSKVSAPHFWGGAPRQVMGIHNAANMLLGCPFEWLPGHGHGGATAQECLEALPDLLAHYRPSAAFIHPFENDVGATNLDVMMAQADLAVVQCLRSNTVPILVASLPTTAVNAGRAAIFDSIRDYVLSIGAKFPGAIGVEPGAVYLDASNPATPRAPAAGWTDGTVHPVPSKMATIGQGLVPALLSLLPADYYPDWSSMLLGLNPRFTGVGGTAVNLQAGSVVPSNTTITAAAGVSVTTSITADRRLRVTGSIAGASTTADAVTIVQTGWTYPKTWGPRTRVKVMADVELLNASGIFTLNNVGSIGAVESRSLVNADASAALDPALIGKRFAIEGHVCPVADVTATTATLTFSVRAMNIASPSGVVFDFILTADGWLTCERGERFEGALSDI